MIAAFHEVEEKHGEWAGRAFLNFVDSLGRDDVVCLVLPKEFEDIIGRAIDPKGVLAHEMAARVRRMAKQIEELGGTP